MNDATRRSLPDDQVHALCHWCATSRSLYPYPILVLFYPALSLSCYYLRLFRFVIIAVVPTVTGPMTPAPTPLDATGKLSRTVRSAFPNTLFAYPDSRSLLDHLESSWSILIFQFPDFPSQLPFPQRLRL